MNSKESWELFQLSFFLHIVHKNVDNMFITMRVNTW